jgi:hypothetical protein
MCLSNVPFKCNLRRYTEDHTACLLGFIGRLDEQKGIDLILNSEEFLMNQHVQIVFLGGAVQLAVDPASFLKGAYGFSTLEP